MDLIPKEKASKFSPNLVFFLHMESNTLQNSCQIFRPEQKTQDLFTEELLCRDEREREISIYIYIEIDREI